MRFASFPKPVALVLAFAAAASSMGCAADDTDPANDAVGVVQQGDTVAEVLPKVGAGFGGLNAAISLYGWFTTYQKYGTLQITNGALLNEATKLRGEIAQLRSGMTGLEGKVTEANTNFLNQQALAFTSNVTELWSAYLDTPADGRAAWLQTITGNISGSVRWADLTNVNNLIVGKGGSSSLLTLMAKSEERRGLDGIETDVLGAWMAEKLLVQEQAFELLSQRDANNAAVDVAYERTLFDERIAAQKSAFLAATRAYNAAVLSPVRSARASQVGSCDYLGDTFFVPLTPNDGPYRIQDSGCATSGGNRVTSATTCGGGWIDYNLANCNDTRNRYMQYVGDQAAAPSRAKMFATQTLYDLQNLAGEYASDDARATVSLSPEANTVTWTTSTGESWPLVLTTEPTLLSNPTERGHEPGSTSTFDYRTPTVTFHASGAVTAIVGPKGSLFRRVAPTL